MAITPEITPLFADDTALYCSEKSSTELQQMLKEDLASVAEWLNEHNLTLNEAKSKFLIIGSSQRLKSLEKTSLQICGEFLDKADCYKYLGVIINETLTWSDYVDYISTKVNQRLGILRRIKHLLPIQTREPYIKSMILPLFNYSDIDWLVLSERRREFKLIHLRDTHSYNARHKHNFEMPKSRCQKGQERLTYQALHEWNALPISTRNSIWSIWEAYKNYFIYFKILSTLSWDFTIIVCFFNF